MDSINFSVDKPGLRPTIKEKGEDKLQAACLSVPTALEATYSEEVQAKFKRIKLEADPTDSFPGLLSLFPIENLTELHLSQLSALLRKGELSELGDKYVYELLAHYPKERRLDYLSAFTATPLEKHSDLKLIASLIEERYPNGSMSFPYSLARYLSLEAAVTPLIPNMSETFIKTRFLSADVADVWKKIKPYFSQIRGSIAFEALFEKGLELHQEKRAEFFALAASNCHNRAFHLVTPYAEFICENDFNKIKAILDCLHEFGLTSYLEAVQSIPLLINKDAAEIRQIVELVSKYSSPLSFSFLIGLVANLPSSYSKEEMLDMLTPIFKFKINTTNEYEAKLHSATRRILALLPSITPEYKVFMPLVNAMVEMEGNYFEKLGLIERTLEKIIKLPKLEFELYASVTQTYQDSFEEFLSLDAIIKLTEIDDSLRREAICKTKAFGRKIEKKQAFFKYFPDLLKIMIQLDEDEFEDISQYVNKYFDKIPCKVAFIQALFLVPATLRENIRKLPHITSDYLGNVDLSFVQKIPLKNRWETLSDLLALYMHFLGQQSLYNALTFLPADQLPFVAHLLNATRSIWQKAYHIDTVIEGLVGIFIQDDHGDEAFYFSLAKLLANLSSNQLASRILEFKLDKEEQRIYITKLLAKSSYVNLCQNYHNFKITDRDASREIVEIIFKQCPMVEYLDLFNLDQDQDQALLIRLAYLAFQGGYNYQFFDKFKIKDIETRIDLAKLAAEKKGASFFDNIALFQLDKYSKYEQLLEELAWIALKADSYNITSLLTPKTLFKNEAFVFNLQKTAIKMGRKLSSILHADPSLMPIHKFELAKLQATHMENEFFKHDEAVLKFFNAEQSVELLLYALTVYPEAIERVEIIYVSNELTSLLSNCFQNQGKTQEKLEALEEFANAQWPKGKASLLLNDIRSLDNFKAENSIQWLAFTFVLFKLKNIDLGAYLEPLSVILGLPDRALRYKLTISLVEHVILPGKMPFYLDLTGAFKDSKAEQQLLIPALLLCDFFETHSRESKESVFTIAKLIMQNRAFCKKANIQKKGLMLETLYLLSQSSLDSSECLSLIQMALTQSEKAQKKEDTFFKFSIINGLLRMFCDQELGMLSAKGNLEQFLQDFFQTALNKHYPNFALDYQNTFVNYRDHFSLFVYATKMKSMPDCLEALNTFIDWVFKGIYQSERYDEKRSVHLKNIFQNRDELKAEWMTGEKHLFTSYIKEVSSDIFKVDCKDFLKSKIEYEHIKPNDFPYLMRYLYKDIPIMEDDLKSANPKELAKRVLQNKMIQLCETQDLKEMEVLLDDLIKEFEMIQNNVFVNDLKGLKTSIKDSNKKISYDHYTIVDTDHPWDIFRLGTDLRGSCQDIYGDASYNKCLLGYVLDGKDRLLAITDSQGKIVARCIFRLLWDPINQTPALFQEELYPDFCRPEFSNALNLLAVNRAKKCKLPLYRSGPDKVQLTSLSGTVAPWEYVDALKREAENGTFTIKHASLVKTT